MAVGDKFIAKLFAHGGAGEQLLTTYGYVQVSGILNLGVAGLVAAAGVLDSILSAAYIGLLTNNITFDKVQVTCIEGLNVGAQGEDGTSAGATGGSAGTIGSIERCLILSKRTGFVGRKFRGRVFVPAVCKEMFQPEGSYNPGNPDFATIGAFSGQMILDVTPFAGVLWSPCIHHHVSPPIAPSIYRTVIVNTTVGIQRRRRIGIGS